jgi:membrane-bound metal-dependent hydrolase YbcI (DUF457 family)
VKLFNLFSKEHQLEYSHRGFLHSVMGVTVTTGLLGVYISPVLIYIGFFSPLYLGTFLLSIGIAQIFHMLEDSCTKSGIAWLEPFSSTRMRGALTTSPEFIHTLPPRVLGAVLGLITAGSLYFGMMDPQPLTDLEIARRAGVLVSGTWLVFLFLVARIRLD